jgi:hypothetical protein
VCVEESINDSIVKANPNRAKSQEILKRRQHEKMIDEVNKRIYERSRRAIRK